MSNVNSEEVMRRLLAHPLYKKVIASVSIAEKEQIEKTVVVFVEKLSTSLTQVAAHPDAREKMREVAKVDAPTSGSIG